MTHRFGFLISALAAIGLCTAWMSAESAQTTRQSAAAAPSDGFRSCHKGATDPHPVAQDIGCVGCHGGNGAATTKEQAHTAKPSHPEAWPSAANPRASYTLLNHENWDWIRFVNPSDLRSEEHTSELQSRFG